MRAPVKRATIERRKAALFKKAEELSVLCGSEIGIAIASPAEGGPVVCWPEMEVAKKRFMEFMKVPAEERGKKMVLHEECMRVRVSEEIEKMRKKEEEVERKEMNLAMKEVIGGKIGLREMDARQLKGLYDLAGEKMAELEKRKRDFQNDDGGESYYVPQPPAPLIDATWCIPAMEAPPHGGGGEGSYQQMLFSAAAAAGSGAITNSAGHHQLPNNYFSSST